ncbi:MAG TPA: acyl-CoA dehydrogenase family protein [Candidatus Limnocylindria bacterium]|nr:acyl-CoA dehydrogenase family protein [Candidatus Limnocylindria bacterium]
MRLAVGDTERRIASSVREFAAGLGETVPRAEAAGSIPPEVIAGLARLGLLGITVPERDGGLGASTAAFALALEELAAAWPALSVAVSVNSGIVARSIVALGTPAQRAAWLPRLMDGRGLGAFCLTEPSSGSDAASLRATARPDGDGYVIDGTKLFITNARYAPLFIVLARVGERDVSRAHAGITAFVVPAGAPGLTVGPGEKKLGLLASDTSSVILEGVRVGQDAVLGEVGRGFSQVAMAGLDGGRIGIAAQAVGIARGALDRAAAYAKERRQFGRPIASFESMRFAFAQARTDLEAARLLVLRAAALRDAGRPHTREASEAKLFASEAANRICHFAVQALGGYGYVRAFGVERQARDARATTIYEGTSEIQRLVIARSLLGEAA